ncbi:MAG TPA: NAD-dependent epimerase/dehydratase family protein [Trebonia sp.]|nr:NAD-dependent epimerase/dehydratase family protein [Trebonia sp.]
MTGGSGFLGRHVLAAAARRGHCCVALARSPAAADAVARCGAAPLAGDLDDGLSLSAAFASADCEALVNLASLGFGHAPGIVAAAVAARLDRAVFVSTTAVTTALPARSKAVRLAAEEHVRCSPLAWTILRPTMIYGAPGDRNLSRLLAALARAARLARPARLPVVVPVPGGGTRLQQPVHVADLAEAVLAAAERPQSAGSCYDVAGPEPLAFGELLRLSSAAVGCRAHLLPVPLPAVIALTRGYERLARRPRIRAEQWQRLAEDKAFPIGAAVRDLGYAPRSFAEGISQEATALGLAPGHRHLSASDLPAQEPCLTLPRVPSPRPSAGACRCAARPGCCSAPMPGPAISPSGRRSG